MGLVAYSGALNAGFVSDDWDFLLRVHGTPSLDAWFQTINGRYFRPGVVAIYHVNYHAFGLWPLPFHVTTLLLHILTAWLVYRLAMRVDHLHRASVGFWSGMIFLVFAGHSEPVSCIAGVADPALAPSMLGGILLFARALESSDPWRLMVSAWILGAAGIMAKETAVVFPALAAVYGLFEISRSPDRWQTFRRTAVFVAVPAVLVAAYLLLRAHLFGSPLGAYSMLSTSAGAPVKMARAFVLRAFLPPMDWLNGLWQTDRDIVLLLVAAATLAAVAVWRAESRRAIAFAIAGMCVALAPALPLTISLATMESERFVYLASAFSTILVVVVVTSVLPRRPAAVVLCMVALAHAVFLHRSNAAWHDAGELGRRVVTGVADAVRTHDPELRRQVFVLNTPDSVRGAFVLRRGFHPALELLAPDVARRARVTLLSSQTTASLEDVPRVEQTAPGGFSIDIGGNMFMQAQPPASPFWTISGWTRSSYHVDFSPTIGRALVLHMTGGGISVAGEASGPGLPFGHVDDPASDAVCSGDTMLVAGWALDDEEVRDVAIVREAFPAESAAGVVRLGTARWESGTRPDVAAIFAGFPHADRAGWTFELPCAAVRSAPDGLIRLHGIASDGGGHQAELGERTIRARR